MTATSLNALRNAPPSLEATDDRMDQVRELLVGEHIRTSDTRLAALEARVRDLETEVSRQVDAISVRLEAMAGEVNAEHRNSFNELATSVSALGETIRRINKP